jgi:lipopolysaccharide transport system permease protein
MKSACEQRYGSDSVWRDPGRFLTEFIRDLRNSHELAWQLFLRNLKSRYRQSITGYIWAFFPPLAWTGLFVILRLHNSSEPQAQYAYIAHVMVGVVFWQVFIEAVQTPMRTFSEARSMLAKLKFPREALIAAGLLDVGLQFLIRLPLLFVGWMLFPEATAHGW